MTIGAAHDATREVDYFSLHSRKKKHIDVEMLDYGYVEKCSDLDEMKGILALLRSGAEGRYPHLEKFTEDRLLQLMPGRERNKILRMRTGPSAAESQLELEQLTSWTADISQVHHSLQSRKSATARRLPPVRGQNTATGASKEALDKKQLISEVDPEQSFKPKKSIPAYDFRAWEKFDVDSAIQEIDEAEHRARVHARLQREEMERREKERKKELASLPEYIEVDEMSEAERKVLARVEKEKGNDSFRANENEEATLYYTRSMAFDDTEPTVYSNRAAAHLRLKNFAQAEEDCSRAILLDPTYCKAWRRRGMTRFRRGKYAEAIEDFQYSLQLEPGNVEVEKLLKKTMNKWKDVDGTGLPQDNQVCHDVSTSHTSTGSSVGLNATTKKFTRFEIAEEDDEDDDPSLATTDDKPTQRFEIIED